MTEPAAISGQAPTGAIEPTVTAPVEQPGKSVDNTQTSQTAPVVEDSFFDPKDIIGTPAEKAYKQMQADYTKKMKFISSSKQKIDAYERFEKNPHEAVRLLAQQYGIKIEEPKKQEDWNPQTWDEVKAKSKEEAKDEVLRELSPYLNEVKAIKKQAIEKQLSDIDPQWQLYEDQMSENLQKHPSLVSDPATLYRISVPAEVHEQRAMKKAIEQINGKKETTPSGGSLTPKTPSNKPSGPLTWEQSIAAAHADLASRGIRPG